MSEALRRLSLSRWLPICAAFILAAGLWAEDSPRCGALADYGTFPVDWCYFVDVQITYSGAGTLTDHAFRVPVNASSLVTTGQMDAHAWDVRAYLSVFANQTNVLAQSMTSTAASWWFHVPSIASGQTRTITLQFGAADVARNQGVLFTGGDEVSAPHDAAFNIADDLTLQVEVEALNVSATTTMLLAGHWDANAGYKAEMVTATSTRYIRATVDSSTCDAAWASTWTNTNRLIEVGFASGTTTIQVDGTVQATCGGGPGAISSTSTPFLVGTDLDRTIIRDVRVLSAASVVTHWCYDPADMTETVSTNPYQGTVAECSGAGYTATYTFDRDQAAVTTDAGGTQLTSAPPLASTPTPVVQIPGNIFGEDDLEAPVAGTDASATSVEECQTLFCRLYLPAALEWPGPRSLFWALLFSGASLGLMLGLWIPARGFIPLVLFSTGVPMLIGMNQGYLSYWYLMLWAAWTIVSWFAVQGSQKAT